MICVVGAGAAGLASAAALRRTGAEVVVLERDAVAAAWQARYHATATSRTSGGSGTAARPRAGGLCGGGGSRVRLVARQAEQLASVAA